MTRRSCSATDRALDEWDSGDIADYTRRQIRTDAAGRHAPYRQPDDPGVDAPDVSGPRVVVWLMIVALVVVGCIGLIAWDVACGGCVL